MASALSTPSATTRMPSACASAITVFTICLSVWSTATVPMKRLSILISAAGICFKYVNDE